MTRESVRGGAWGEWEDSDQDVGERRKESHLASIFSATDSVCRRNSFGVRLGHHLAHEF